jgi:hypothetical protein
MILDFGDQLRYLIPKMRTIRPANHITIVRGVERIGEIGRMAIEGGGMNSNRLRHRTRNRRPVKIKKPGLPNPGRDKPIS